jgi:hypothetical protein
MQQRKIGVLPQSLLVGCLCAVAFTPGLAQGRGTSSTTSAEIPAQVQQRSQEIQQIMDRSDERVQAAEGHFSKGEYERRGSPTIARLTLSWSLESTSQRRSTSAVLQESGRAHCATPARLDRETVKHTSHKR